jgi:hypothetical protein
MRHYVLAPVLVAVLATSGLSLPDVARAVAPSGPIYPVTNTSEYPPDGVWFRNAPDWNDTSKVTGWGVYAADRVQLECWQAGADNVLRKSGGNNVWYIGFNVTRPTRPGGENSGWINAHFVNDGTQPYQVAPDVPACVNGTVPQPQPPPQPPPPQPQPPPPPPQPVPAAGSTSAQSTPATRTTTSSPTVRTTAPTSPSTNKVTDVCFAAYGAGHQQTHSIFGGEETRYDRNASLLQQCEGFGAPDGLTYSPALKCAIVAMAVDAAAPHVGAGNLCDAAGFAEQIGRGDWLGAAGGLGCAFFGEVFSVGAATVIAGAASATGPGAVVIGVASYKALAAFLTLACGGIFDGGAKTFGSKLEQKREGQVAADIFSKGKCLRYRKTFGWISWSSAGC